MMINSRNNSKILNVISYYEEENIVRDRLFVNEGYINLLECLKWGKVKEIYYTKKYIEEIQKLDIESYLVSEDVMKKMSKMKNPCGLIFLSETKTLNIKNPSKIIYLDDVQDPGNVGTIIRTALAFNYDLVILSPRCANMYNHKVLSASRGSVYKIDVIKDEFDNVIKTYPNHKIVSTTLSDDSVELDNFNIHKDFIVVFGNEGHGINESIINHSDYKIKIAMNEIDSLNVALSAAIILHKLK